MAVDTHRIAQRLRENGAFTEQQADTVVEAVSEFVNPIATKSDLELLRAELRVEIAENRTEIQRSHKNLVMWVASLGALLLATHVASVIAILAQF